MVEKIKKYWHRFVGFIKTPRGAIITSLGVIILVSLALMGKNNPLAAYDIGQVVRKDIISIVDVTGRIKPTERVDIALERTGKVSRINVRTGEEVARGDLLVSAAGADLYADLAEVQSTLKMEQLELEEISKTSRVNLDSAEEDAWDTIRDTYVTADDIVRSKADQLFHGSTSSKSFGAILVSGGTESTFGATASQTVDLQQRRMDILDNLEIWEGYLGDPEDVSADEALDKAETYLTLIEDFLTDIALVINSYYEDSASNTVLSGYRSTIATARTTISSALTDLRTASHAYSAAKAASLSSTEDQLQGVLLQEQVVKGAEARVNAVYAEIAKSVVRAPFDGVITKIDTEVGEIVPANTPIVSLMSNAKFEIETFVPEADIADVAVGNLADVTLDAYGSDTVFGAYVSFIDPAETMIEGVATYKVLLNFNEEDERILSGMTANVDVVTSTSPGTLSVPQRAVIEKDGKRLVKVVRDGKTVEVEVKTGLKGSDGDIEILEGLNEGDSIVVFTRG